MFDKEKIKAHITKAIAIIPTPIELLRIPDISDDMNGTIKGKEYTVAKFDAILDNGSAQRSSATATTRSDGGHYESIKDITLMCTSDDEDGNPFTILFEDYFVVNGVSYSVVQPNLVYGIYWMCKLEAAV